MATDAHSEAEEWAAAFQCPHGRMLVVPCAALVLAGRVVVQHSPGCPRYGGNGAHRG